MALSGNEDYFELSTDDKFNYNKTQADWYIDGGIIPFTTDYKEFDHDPGEYYFMLRAAALVMVTTVTVLQGKQTFEIYSEGYGVSVDVTADTKSAPTRDERPRRSVTIRR